MFSGKGKRPKGERRGGRWEESSDGLPKSEMHMLQRTKRFDGFPNLLVTSVGWMFHLQRLMANG